MVNDEPFWQDDDTGTHTIEYKTLDQSSDKTIRSPRLRLRSHARLLVGHYAATAQPEALNNLVPPRGSAVHIGRSLGKNRQPR
jgi:hypothetical protein